MVCPKSLVLAAAAAGTVTAQTFNRRLYSNTNDCTGTVTNIISVWSNTPCQAPGFAACEKKSAVAGYLSSEATGCESSPLVDTPYLPVNRVAGQAFLTINSYYTVGSTSCSLSSGTQLTQTTYIADGQCYVMEPGYYFKVSCSQSSGTVAFCNEGCTNCTTQTYNTQSCTAAPDGSYTSVVCGTGASANTTSTNSTTSSTPSPVKGSGTTIFDSAATYTLGGILLSLSALLFC
ncbi:uncharacterized protein BJ171DRAFT_183459 [Polychytrium aggregatum]|uniref:uncharacterized protein n=1 Tax=Polychytrium aggregatum TaxID=110093 RepID=UPI0022FE6824|nr:uncharacterized protein BJ171DRAFT_183459 [Polychytrium aggregatum]KAI9202353.1 hypothetical protein BJ171DRAFT_183459 [Polychytrium aggregatum]